jgi:signal transduction histidine kinase
MLGEGSPHEAQSREALERRLEKLVKINAALMNRVERSMEQQANAYTLFQTAIGLEAQVRLRTDELKTALHRLEEANDELVAARDAAELANRLKTRFFTAVGHDLLQPLHAARLTLSSLERTGEAESGRLLQQIDHALSTIEELLKTILDLSKLEAGAITPEFQAVPLAPLLRSLVMEFEPLAHAKGLALACRASNVGVRSDPLMLRRMIQNLLVNALHYTERGAVKVFARRRGEDVRIEVWDTGPGIPAAERTRIFEEFQRGSASERAGRGGMGLGLSIVQRMGVALGHRIELCSKEGRGTRFSILAPRATGLALAEPVPALAAAPRDAYGFAGAHVLVIDNDAAGLEAMRTLLGRWGCETRGLRDLSGLDALLRDEPAFHPNLVIADFHLDRGERGLHAVERLRCRSGGELPAVVITADHSPAIAAESRRLGCEVLCKPVKPAELRALMGHLLRERDASGPR